MANAQDDLIETASKAVATHDIAARILPLIDLTSLNDDDTEARIEAVVDRGMKYGVAAVCRLPHFVQAARRRLGTDPVQLASVVNFPDGSDDIARAVRETEAIVADGGDEIDMVAPLDAIMDGDVGMVSEMVDAVKAVADGRMVKVILETGRLEDPARITAAARSAVMARRRHAENLHRQDADGRPSGRCGRAARGDRGGRWPRRSQALRWHPQAREAAGYLHLIDHFMTSGWVSPRTVRFGASACWTTLVRVLAVPSSTTTDEAAMPPCLPQEIIRKNATARRSIPARLPLSSRT